MQPKCRPRSDCPRKCILTFQIQSQWLMPRLEDLLGGLRSQKNKRCQSDYPRTPQDTPGHPRTLQDSIIGMFNILYERVDDGLVLVCWCIN